MRNLRALDAFRIPDTPYDHGDVGGAFLIPYPLAGEKLVHRHRGRGLGSRLGQPACRQTHADLGRDGIR